MDYFFLVYAVVLHACRLCDEADAQRIAGVASSSRGAGETKSELRDIEKENLRRQKRTYSDAGGQNAPKPSLGSVSARF